MTPISQPSTVEEESRLRGVYERRKAEIPKERYSYFNAANLLSIQERERRVLALLARNAKISLNEMKILEVGCGTGLWLREFIKWGARPENIVGLDLLPDRIEECRQLCPAAVTAHCANASRIDAPDRSFDLLLQSTVFSSVLDKSARNRMAAEMVRVLRDDGIILWYDFFVNNPNNPDVRGITRRQIMELFPGAKVSSARITLAPPLARFLAPYSRLLCQALAALRILDTHLLAVISKPARNS
jgi:ubiquinone/menaquinone biosynthesis C-methylase UbiE